MVQVTENKNGWKLFGKKCQLNFFTSTPGEIKLVKRFFGVVFMLFVFSILISRGDEIFEIFLEISRIEFNRFYLFLAIVRLFVK